MADPHGLLLLIGCKASLILAIVAVLLYATGRRWPRGCTQWQRLGVLALLLLPVATFFFPPIPIPILPAQERVVITRNESVPSRDSFPASKFVPANIPDFDDHDLTLASTTPNLTQPFENVSIPAQPVSVPIPADPQPRSLGISWNAVLSLIYGIVMSVFLLRLVGAGRGLGRLKRTGTRIDDAEWQRLLSHWVTMLRIRRAIDLRVTDEVSVPMTFGWLTPVILVPRDCLTSCDRTQREAILIHELTHVARGDFLWQILTQLAVAVYWLHPLVWLVRRESEVLRERLCDQFCSQQLGRETYARALVSIAARSRNLPAIGLGMAMAQRTSLRQRLADLKSGTSISSQRAGRVSGVLICGTATLVLGMIVIGLLSERVSRPATESISIIDSNHPEPEDSLDALIRTRPASSYSLSPEDHQRQLQKPWRRRDPGTQSNIAIESVPAFRSTGVSSHAAGLVATARDEDAVPTAMLMEDPVIRLDGPLNPENVFAPPSIRRIDSRKYTVVTQKFDRSSLPAEFKSKPNPPELIYALVEEADAPKNPGQDFIDTCRLELEEQSKSFNAKVAATVNGKPILNGEVLDNFSRSLRSWRENELRALEVALAHAAPSQADYEKAVEINKKIRRDYELLVKTMVQRNIDQFVQSEVLGQYLLADLTPDEIKMVDARVDEQFTIEIEKLKKGAKVDSLADLERWLKESGTSLQNMKANFARIQLAAESIGIRAEPAVPTKYSEIVDYYQSHLDQYKTPVSAKWNEVTVTTWVDDEPTLRAAKEQLEQIRVKLDQGVSFDDDELTSSDSKHWWIFKMSHFNTPISQQPVTGLEDPVASRRATLEAPVTPEMATQLLSMPLNQWSKVIESPSRYSVVRVLARHQSELKPIDEVHNEIEALLQGEQNTQRCIKYIRKVYSWAQIETEYPIVKFE